MPRLVERTDLIRAGFVDIDAALARLAEAEHLGAGSSDTLLTAIRIAADPDEGLLRLVLLLRQHPEVTCTILADPGAARKLLLVLGASEGLSNFFQRNPAELKHFGEQPNRMPSVEEMRLSLADSVGGVDGFSELTGDQGRNALRIRYRRFLAQIAACDLGKDDQAAFMPIVGAALADLAGAALDAALWVARSDAAGGATSGRTFAKRDVARVDFSVIAMGKTGARELNYISDVDVIFVGQAAEGSELSPDLAMAIATQLGVLVMRGIDELGFEPGLWEVDANLRPEGKDGALVRTLESHVNYYQRWAKGWEFQALLKARPIAGDPVLGEKYVEALSPLVWKRASSDPSFVANVQKMRARVLENIPENNKHYEIKLGPGGLRDIEFTVQLLQLVHGHSDESIRQRDTLGALAALSEAGYIGRAEGNDFSQQYRFLRLLEHRLQLSRLRRTHIMPRDQDSLRVLARASGVAGTADELVTAWNATKHVVRSLHERLFYRPLLSAVAALPEEGTQLTTAQAGERLSAIGFTDPRGAIARIKALSSGVSRRAQIQRHLLPVLLEWIADGADPDYGLLAFRKLSDTIGDSHWYLRMLRDSSGAAHRLTTILSNSRFIGELIWQIPESAAWLESDSELTPRSLAQLTEQVDAIVARHDSPDGAASVLRQIRRKEILRIAISRVLGLCDVVEVGRAIADIDTALLRGILATIRQSAALPGGDGIEFGIIGMGRFGGREMVLGSDVDVMYVYRAVSVSEDTAASLAKFISNEITRLAQDTRVPLDIDLDLRPEGKQGPSVRTLASYANYYERWAEVWEFQALVRASPVAGDQELLNDFADLIDQFRYPAVFPDASAKTVRRIKARVENERLPQGSDRTRQLKLGDGSLSDVEWLVQLMQLQHAHHIDELRDTQTLSSLDTLRRNELVSDDDAKVLAEAWTLASDLRNAITLYRNRPSDILPSDREVLDGVARILGMPAGSASDLEEHYLSCTRRARKVYERLFYGPAVDDSGYSR